MDRDVLTDSQWERIENLLPGRVGYVGGTSPDNRLFLEAVIWVFGKAFTTVSTAGATLGVWERVFEALCQDPDFEYVMIDSTIVRAHQHAAGAKGGRTIRHWAVVEVVFPQKSMRLWMPWETPFAAS